MVPLVVTTGPTSLSHTDPLKEFHIRSPKPRINQRDDMFFISRFSSLQNFLYVFHTAHEAWTVPKGVNLLKNNSRQEEFSLFFRHQSLTPMCIQWFHDRQHTDNIGYYLLFFSRKRGVCDVTWGCRVLVMMTSTLNKGWNTLVKAPLPAWPWLDDSIMLIHIYRLSFLYSSISVSVYFY